MVVHYNQGELVNHLTEGVVEFRGYETYEGVNHDVVTVRKYTPNKTEDKQVLVSVLEPITGEQVIEIGKYINDIPLNGLEYLCDNEGNSILFHTKDEAKTFLRVNGYNNFTEDEMEDYFVFNNVKDN